MNQPDNVGFRNEIINTRRFFAHEKACFTVSDNLPADSGRDCAFADAPATLRARIPSLRWVSGAIMYRYTIPQSVVDAMEDIVDMET